MTEETKPEVTAKVRRLFDEPPPLTGWDRFVYGFADARREAMNTARLAVYVLAAIFLWKMLFD